MRKTYVFLAFVWLCAMTPLFAFVPSQVNYQGRLSDPSGNPLTDTVSLTFSIHESPGGGISIWSETHPSVPVVDGIFTVVLGRFTPLDESVFDITTIINRYLAISVNGAPALQPLQEILAVPYALRVATVDDATGGVIDGKLRVGTSNTNGGADAFVAGTNNKAEGAQAAITGGGNNTATGERAFVGGGSSNDALGTRSFVGGGENNTADTTYASVVGGRNNVASGSTSIVAGGTANHATGDRAAILGGINNLVSGSFSMIGTGYNSEATGDFSGVMAGMANAARGELSFVGGGGGSSAYGGSLPQDGDSNVALGSWSVVVGGHANIAGGEGAFVGGGGNHRTLSDYSFIGGGQSNTTQGNSAAIVAGVMNTTKDDFAFVGGGQSNAASGRWSTVPGGRSNAASANYSFAAGRRALATHVGTFVWADSVNQDFHSTAANQFLVRAGGGVGIGTSSPKAPLHVQKGSTGILFPCNSTMMLESTNGCVLSMSALDDQPTGLYMCYPNSSPDGVLQFNSAGVPHGWQFQTNTNPIALNIDAAGNVGVGDTTPEEKLKVQGNILASGTVCASNIVCPSDERLKTNIRTIEDALTLVEQLRGVKFDWREDVASNSEIPRVRQIGLIAQEVMQIAPEAVVQGADGYYAVDYSRLVPLLIQGMKEQQQQIYEASRQIAELKALVEQLVQ